MKKIGLNQLREMYLSFFESKGHLRLESFPLVPQNDDSLLLINAGMAPLKPYFTGEQIPPARRVTTCQKCIRTPDIEAVGKDARHGTYFEMLGNFSFGDYFKREATAWAWEFITKVLELPVDRIYVSVYLEDDEAYDIWTKEIGVAPDHMVRLGKADNFWEIGSGPCGPCSEIYFDRGEQYKCDNPNCSVGCDCDRYVEFWNLVFTQFNSDGNGNYTPLEHKNIDTGMGMERLACIMQEVDSLFDVDTIARITEHVSKICGVKYGGDQKKDVSLRIITDHIRSTTMMVCDGVMPSNEGRGYVLRRLLRRAARHGRLLGVDKPFLYEVCETVIKENEGAYPQLREKHDYIIKLIKTEEQRFAATIDNGLVKLEAMIDDLEKGKKTCLSGDDAFRLYDTDGFPIDLTVEILEEQGLSVDRDGFDVLMKEQRKRAKDARGNTTLLGWEGSGLSLSEIMPTVFTGYEKYEDTGRVLAIIKGGEFSGSAMEGDTVTVFLDQTPFYAESGGQVTDQGTIMFKSGSAMVNGVAKTPDGKFMHKVTIEKGELSVDDEVDSIIDIDRRRAVMRAHSATHMLQKALREVLGSHVEQAGSLVEPDRLRFDFTHFSAMTPDELKRVENIVNGAALNGYEVNVTEMPIDEAKKLGAMALFGEKYGSTVRVVKMGDYSIELCGGTHLDNTAKIGSFKIIGEASVAAGVRRIEAVCGAEIINMVRQLNDTVEGTSEILKAPAGDILRKSAQIMAELRQVSHDKDILASRLASSKAAELVASAKEIGAVRLIAAKVDIDNMDDLRSLADKIRDRDASVICVLAAVQDEAKINFAAVCGVDAVKAGAHSGNILKQVAKIAGGGGGGRPDSATAGGKDPSRIDEAIGAVAEIVSSMLK
ncbi:MAG: alanine--tRNA ligase [Clostridiaceae bacterium]|nr:alanine--tRNA ligase [Clostridiaceae bacterium]